MKKFFNLIEVTLSIAIVGIGIAGIMSLFPVGFQASRDAIGDNYAADAADVFAGYVMRECNETATAWEALIDDVTVNNGTEFPHAKPATGTDVVIQAAETLAINYTTTPLESGIYQSATPMIGLYGIRMGSSTVVDFDAVVRVWTSKISNMTVAGYEVEPFEYAYGGARLNVEVSWPAGKPYSKREKRFYCVEIFRY